VRKHDVANRCLARERCGCQVWRVFTTRCKLGVLAGLLVVTSASARWCDVRGRQRHALCTAPPLHGVYGTRTTSTSATENNVRFSREKWCFSRIGSSSFGLVRRFYSTPCHVFSDIADIELDGVESDNDCNLLFDCIICRNWILYLMIWNG